MSFELNDKIKSMTPYEPISGSYRIRLDANESFSPPSDEVLADIKTAVESVHFNRYPDPFAQELCLLAASYYGVKPELVTAGNGSDELISIIMNAFLQKGDKVLTFAPDFSMYSFYSSVVESPCIILPKKDDFTIDIDAAIEEANKQQIRLIVFSNPCNPTSIGLNKTEVKKLISSVNSLVVLDEAYMEFYGQSLLSEIENYDNLIILRTVSKAMGMAAIRLGFAITNQTLTNVIRTVKSPYNVNAVTQAIGSAVLAHKEYISNSVMRINSSRDMLYDEFKRLAKAMPDKIKPVAADANFVYTYAQNAGGLFEFLMKSGVIVRCFGEYLRVTAGRNHENIELIQAIEKFYQ